MQLKVFLPPRRSGLWWRISSFQVHWGGGTGVCLSTSVCRLEHEQEEELQQQGNHHNQCQRDQSEPLTTTLWSHKTLGVKNPIKTKFRITSGPNLKLLQFGCTNVRQNPLSLSLSLCNSVLVLPLQTNPPLVNKLSQPLVAKLAYSMIPTISRHMMQGIFIVVLPESHARHLILFRSTKLHWSVDGSINHPKDSGDRATNMQGF